MTAWPQVQLIDVAFFQEGPGLRNWQWAENGIKVINGRNVLVDGQINLSNTDKFVSWEEFHSKYKHFQIQANDIVVTSSGTLGKVGRIRPEHLPLMMNTSVIRFRPNDCSVLNDGFLFAYLRSSLFQEKVTAYAIGAAQSNFGPSHLKLFSMPLPPIGVQRRIAGILSTYDELIENSQRRIKVLESMARALYREWFVHFRFPGYESVPGVPTPLGGIPQGWEVKKLGDLCELRKDPYRDSDHSDLPLLDMARMPSRSLAPTDTGSPAELTTSRILFKAGDTLFGAIRCYLHKVVEAHYPGVTNTSVLVLRPRSPSFRALVAVIASDIDTIRWAETQSTGTKMPVINWGVFQGMPSPIPSKSVAQVFEDIAGPMLDEIGALASQIQTLRRTRDLLLPRLISGQIDVEASVT